MILCVEGSFMPWLRMYIVQDLMIWEFWWIEHRGAEPKMPDSRVATMDMENLSVYYYSIIMMK